MSNMFLKFSVAKLNISIIKSSEKVQFHLSYLNPPDKSWD